MVASRVDHAGKLARRRRTGLLGGDRTDNERTHEQRGEGSGNKTTHGDLPVTADEKNPHPSVDLTRRPEPNRRVHRQLVAAT